jgi:hypothetical protein
VKQATTAVMFSKASDEWSTFMATEGRDAVRSEE